MSMTREYVAVYGPYRVQHDPLTHMPYGLYRVYKGEKYIGAQLSYPSAEDCRWIELHRYTYAKPEETAKFVPYREKQAARRGRPTNAERARRQALLDEELRREIPTL